MQKSSRSRRSSRVTGSLLALAAGVLATAAPGALPAQAPGEGELVRPVPAPPAEVPVLPPSLLLTAWGEVAPPLPFEKLVVLNRAAAEAVLVDPRTRRVVARVPTGPGPHEVAVSLDGRFAYVANYGSTAYDAEPFHVPAIGVASAGADQRGTVTVVDLETGTVRATFQPGSFRFLHGIRVNQSGTRLWITAEADSAVLEVDAETGDLLMLWKTGGAMGHTLAVTPEGRKLFIANRGSDSVTVIDRATVVAHRIPAGRGPEGIDVSPDGREVWVGNRGDHSITVIDARRQRALAGFPSGGRDPARLRFTPDGREVWVSNRESRELAVFDARSRELVATVALGVEPLSLLFSPDGRHLFVSAPDVDRVVVVDTVWRTVLDSFHTGPAPEGLGWSHMPLPAAAGR